MKQKIYILIIAVILILNGINLLYIRKNKTSNPNNFEFNDPNLLKNELNQSIIDGFFDGDSTKITSNTYFLK